MLLYVTAWCEIIQHKLWARFARAIYIPEKVNNSIAAFTTEFIGHLIIPMKTEVVRHLQT